ncbi:MAG: rod shape-determining protein MreC [Bordetella sp.]
MALSQSPPAFFRQGLSARIKLAIALTAAVVVMQLDRRFVIATPLRQGVSVILYPVTEALLMPRDFAYWAGERLQSVSELANEVDRLRDEKTDKAQTLLLVNQLRSDNENLRALLNLKSTAFPESRAGEVRASLKDGLARKVLINLGLDQGLSVGDPVINSDGVIGQVSRVFPLTSEMRLLSDEQLFVPVFLPGSGVRGITQGNGQADEFRVRYVNLAAELKEGDEIVTSGLDGLYPAGLPVGRVSLVVPAAQGQFPTVTAIPAASVARYKEVLVILRKGGTGNAASTIVTPGPAARSTKPPATSSATTNPNAEALRP